VLDHEREIVQRMATLVAKAVQGNGTDLHVLNEAGFKECDTAIVAIGNNMEGSILTAMNLKELGVPDIVAKAVTDMHGKVLERIGVNLVIYPDRERAQRLARSLLAGSPLDYFEISEGVSVVEMTAPSAFAGKNLIETEMRRTHRITVLAIKRPSGANGKEKRIISPTADDVIESGDVLVLFGPNKELEALAHAPDDDAR